MGTRTHARTHEPTRTHTHPHRHTHTHTHTHTHSNTPYEMLTLGPKCTKVHSQPPTASTLQPSFVELPGSPYYKRVPLPRIPSVHKLGTKSRIAQRSEHATVFGRLCSSGFLHHNFRRKRGGMLQIQGGISDVTVGVEQWFY